MNKMQTLKTKTGIVYEEEQEKAGFAVGDTVEIIRKANSRELGWANSWQPAMNNIFGKQVIIGEFRGASGIRFVGQEYCYPFFILKLVKHKQIYSVGQHFMNYDDEYILTCVETDKINMISLRTGNRWSATVEVKNPWAVTKQELTQLVGQYNKFTLKVTDEE